MEKQIKPSKKALEKYQDLSKEEKTKKLNMLVNDIEIFLKKRKTKSVNMIAHVLKNKDEKRRLVDYRKNYSKIQKNKDWLIFLAIPDFF